MKELTLDANIDNLYTALDFINTELEANHCPIKLQYQIAIAVEEIFVNIANYAYHQEVGGVIIRIFVKDNVTIEFVDKGAPYNPLEKSDPNTTLSVDERDIGGLGVFMVKKIMDTVEYQHTENRNILTIKKELV